MPKVLIVDDEPAIRQLFQYVFEDEGYEVSTAGNGLEALQALAAGAMDLIILDVSMPEMDGREFMLELTRRAAKTPWLAEIPIIVMTGENFMESGLNQVFAAARGFVCFLPKMTPPELVLEKARTAAAK